MLLFNAGGRTRTGMLLPAADFESGPNIEILVESSGLLRNPIPSKNVAK
jgi:hypothetical protein